MKLWTRRFEIWAFSVILSVCVQLWILSSIGQEPNALAVWFLCTVLCLWVSNDIITLLRAATDILLHVYTGIHPITYLLYRLYILQSMHTTSIKYWTILPINPHYNTHATHHCDYYYALTLNIAVVYVWNTATHLYTHRHIYTIVHYYIWHT